jgi:hypothetical protein
MGNMEKNGQLGDLSKMMSGLSGFGGKKVKKRRK